MCHAYSVSVDDTREGIEPANVAVALFAVTTVPSRSPSTSESPWRTAGVRRAGSLHVAADVGDVVPGVAVEGLLEALEAIQYFHNNQLNLLKELHMQHLIFLEIFWPLLHF